MSLNHDFQPPRKPFAAVRRRRFSRRTLTVAAGLCITVVVSFILFSSSPSPNLQARTEPLELTAAPLPPMPPPLDTEAILPLPPPPQELREAARIKGSARRMVGTVMKIPPRPRDGLSNRFLLPRNQVPHRAHQD